MSKKIKYLAIHCTATPQTATIQSIRNYWKNVLKWKSVGYHYIIEPNGKVVQLADISLITNGVKGFNSESIHISYIGGVDSKNKPIDNRTQEQLKSMIELIKDIKKLFPNIIIQGHRDFGAKKACPSFDVKTWLQKVNL
jgi:N-acetylmuramoyl-L-alanine amidase